MTTISDLFEEVIEESSFDGNIDGMQLIDIDMDGIDAESKVDAALLIENLSKFYYDENFMKEHPAFKKRVDADLESLRILIKMRKTDEVAHDLLIKAISGNSGNASLYKSLTEVQKTIISITTKIGDIITGLNNLMKGYQLEINFDSPEDNEDGTDNNEDNIKKNTWRGTKDFINDMNKNEE